MRFNFLSTKAIIFIGIFVAYSYFMYVNYLSIAKFMGESDILTAMAAYILFNPAYLLIIYGVWSRFGHRMAWKRVVASVLSILSLDFLAVPRLAITDSLVNGAVVTTNIGSFVMRFLENFVPHELSYLLMYFILPVIGLTISVELLGITNFVRERT